MVQQLRERRLDASVDASMIKDLLAAGSELVKASARLKNEIEAWANLKR